MPSFATADTLRIIDLVLLRRQASEEAKRNTAIDSMDLEVCGYLKRKYCSTRGSI